VLRQVLEERLSQMRADAGSDLSDDVRRVMRMGLRKNCYSSEHIALQFSMHRRTLSRRLKGSGLGYRILSNEIKFETACQLLADTDVPLARVAVALGYSEASAFTRAFRRWSGQTPTSWRAGK
jgi:AraC-like DNA-binding protein